MSNVLFVTHVGTIDPQPKTRVELRDDGSIAIDTGEEASSGVIDPDVVIWLFDTLRSSRPDLFERSRPAPFIRPRVTP